MNHLTTFLTKVEVTTSGMYLPQFGISMKRGQLVGAMMHPEQSAPAHT
jgi:hypothetical protein